MSITSRPKSAPLTRPTSFSVSKPIKNILQQRIQGTVTPIPDKSSQQHSKSVTADLTNSNSITSNLDSQKQHNTMDEMRSPRINIGITLDSRLRKTPVFDLLRSTTMESSTLEPQRLNRINSFKHSFIPIARF